MQNLKSLEKSRTSSAIGALIVAGWVLISPGKLLYAKSVSHFAVAQEQMRAHQDAHSSHREFKTNFGDLEYFAIFDGHGGQRGAPLGAGLTHAYARDFLHVHLQERLASVEVDPLTALTAAFVQTDRAVCSLPDYDNSGSTASVMLVDPLRNKIYAANVGDSPIVLAYRDGRNQQISVDHNKGNPEEIARVQVAKIGDPVYRGVFAGVLAISRALGDCEIKAPQYKEASKVNLPVAFADYLNPAVTLDDLLRKGDEFWISPFPSTKSIDMEPDLDFAVITSDGVIDGKHVDADMVAQYIRTARAEQFTIQEIADALIEVVKTHSQANNDDKTVMIVYFEDDSAERSDSAHPSVHPSAHPAGNPRRVGDH